MKYTVGFMPMRIIHYFSLLSNQTFPLMKNKDLQIVLQVLLDLFRKIFDIQNTLTGFIGRHSLWLRIFCSLTGFKKLHRNLGE